MLAGKNLRHAEHAFTADVDIRSSDEILHFILRLAAHGAIHFLIGHLISLLEVASVGGLVIHPL
jgi:hypothetical protein